MSLYSSLFGKNPNSKIILSMLNLAIDQVPRFRDCYIEDGKIVIFTRTGGNNRDLLASEYIIHWDNKDEETLCNIILEHSKYYIKSMDDGFDSTYAYFYFTIPDRWKQIAKKFDNGKVETIAEKFKRVTTEMEGMTKEQMLDDPRFSGIINVINKISEKTNEE